MGKGDRKTKRGKIVKGSYGKLRRRKKPKTPVAVVAAKKKEEKKPTADKPKVAAKAAK